MVSAAAPMLIAALIAGLVTPQESEPYPRASLLGHAVCNTGDLDGDGVDDYAVGAPQAFNAADVQTGAILFFSGATDKPFREVFGTEDQQYFGWRLQSLGDVDGDGVEDVHVGSWGRQSWGVSGKDGSFLWSKNAPYEHEGWLVDGNGGKALFVQSGKLTALLTTSGERLSSVLTGQTGLHYVGDVTGDGRAEFARRALDTGERAVGDPIRIEVLEVMGNVGDPLGLNPFRSLQVVVPWELAPGDLQFSVANLDGDEES